MKKKISVLLLTVLLLFAMSVTAFAAEEPVQATEAEAQVPTVNASITKKLVVAEGNTVPEATFRFDIKGLTGTEPVVSAENITFTSADIKDAVKSTAENGVSTYEIKKAAQIKLGEYKTAGVYEYEVTEVKDTYNGDGTVSYSSDVYTLHVYVSNKGNNGEVYVKAITATANKDGSKQSEIIFTNTYDKTASLEIIKTVEGEADFTKDFEFTIQFTAPPLSNETEFIGHIDGTELHFPVGKTVSFKLHHGQTLVFDSLPVGTRYIVTEIGAEDGYTPKVSVIENGVKLTDKSGEDKDSLASTGDNASGNLVGENQNQVTFVNTYHEAPITGIILNNLPFILLIGITVIAFVALAVLKRKKASKA